MAQASYQYDTGYDALTAAEDDAGLPLAVSIYADRELLRGAMEADARAAGLRVLRSADIAELLDGEAGTIGDAALLDCPSVTGHGGGATLAALARLDMRAARTGAYLVISTSIESLEDIFGCFDQSGAAILVEPTRGERVVALANILSTNCSMGVRELSDDDRLALLRLTEQVGEIAERLEGLSRDDDSSGDAGKIFSFEAKKQEFRGKGADPAEAGEESSTRVSRSPLPDPRLVRQIIRQRQTRAKFFDRELFADPAWDMLLDLTAARAEHERVSVTSLCIASGVPATTALRWISQMVDQGIMERVKDDTDKRRAFIALSDKAADGMARYFAALAKDRETPV